jgi:phage terminase large subunit GpA-like protein
LAKDKPKIVRPKTPKIVAASQVPQSFEELEALMGKADAQAIEREAKRADMMDRVARYRWWIAQHAHRLDSGQKLDFGRYPYQKDIYQDRNPYMVVVGSVQWGKTEWLICTAIALAMCGMGVFYVIDKYEKRDKIVSSRIDPTLHNVPFYKELLRHAAANARSVDNTRFKHIGHGFINFVGSNSEGDFSSYKADCAIIDEHQLCVLNNIAKIDFRMKGSEYQFRFIVGNPRSVGSKDNLNLDWEYQQTDQKKWNVPCGVCGKAQVIRWFTHVVKEDRDPKTGVVRSVTWRDESWTPEMYPRDIKPVCEKCGSTMDRLSEAGQWVAENPGARRSGYQLSNLYNCNARLDGLYEQFTKSLNDPGMYAAFVNDELGEAYSMDGTNITVPMLDRASTGTLSGLDRYEFAHAGEMAWDSSVLMAA